MMRRSGAGVHSGGKSARIGARHGESPRPPLELWRTGSGSTRQRGTRVVERTSEQATPRERQSSRAAFIVFVVVLVFAVPYVLFGVGSYHWFFRDDFFFITNRNATSVNDLFRPYDGHWTTVPVLIFRTLWALFGLRTYVPYQASVLALHLGACALLRI